MSGAAYLSSLRPAARWPIPYSACPFLSVSQSQKGHVPGSGGRWSYEWSFFRAKSTPYFRVTRSKDLISQFVTSILNPPAPCRTRCIALPRLHRSDLMHPARPSSRLISWRQLSGNGYEKGTLLQVSVPFRVFFLKPSPV